MAEKQTATENVSNSEEYAARMRKDILFIFHKLRIAINLKRYEQNVIWITLKIN